MDQRKEKTVMSVTHHSKNGEIVNPGESLRYALTKALVNTIGLDNLVAVYIPSLRKEASA